MKESIFIGAYWGFRKTEVKECSKNILSFLNRITINLNIPFWEKKKNKKSGASQKVQLDVNEIQNLLETGKTGSELYFTIWNGDFESPLDVNIICGGDAKYVKNSVIMHFPQMEKSLIFENLTLYEKLFEIYIDEWDPDNLILTSNEYLSQNNMNIFDKQGGWMVYRKGKGLLINK